MGHHEPIDWDRESETQPVEWNLIDEVTERVERQCEEVFDRHVDRLEGNDYQQCVSLLYDTWKREYADETAPEQGAIYLFAYLVETRGIAEPTDTAYGLGSVAERKPDGETLRRLFEDQLLLPWWIAVRLGVHYTLVLYWLREENIPYMRRNIPGDLLEEIDALEATRDGEEGESGENR